MELDQRHVKALLQAIAATVEEERGQRLIAVEKREREVLKQEKVIESAYNKMAKEQEAADKHLTETKQLVLAAKAKIVKAGEEYDKMIAKADTVRQSIEQAEQKLKAKERSMEAYNQSLLGKRDKLYSQQESLDRRERRLRRHSRTSVVKRA